MKTNRHMMLLNGWNDTDLHYFGGFSGKKNVFSARRDFGVVAGSRPLGRRPPRQGLVRDRGEAAHDSRLNPYAESGRTMKIVRSVSAKDRSAIVTPSLDLDVVHRPGPGGIQIWTRRFIP